MRIRPTVSLSMVGDRASEPEFRRWSMWRTYDDIVAQPTVGRSLHFTSVAGALGKLIPADERPS